MNHALPEPTGTAPYHLPIDKVISKEQINRIGKSGSIASHIVGDTGGTKSPTTQHIVEVAIESDFDRRNPSKNPSFLYHLGDIVYKFGEASEYYSQFYEPYAHYPEPIFEIPGNKDVDVRVNSNENSLEAFVNNFWAKTQAVTPDAGDISRDAMIQPNVYWTLDAPFVTIIGLYSNVPDGGVIKETQFQWLENELRTAPTDKALILSVHHSPFSADEEHRCSDTILKVLDKAFRQSHRLPDIVSRHVHNYQRFTRDLDIGGKKHEIPYLVIGTGGHWKLHSCRNTITGTELAYLSSYMIWMMLY
ncbi:MAG: metallophosphoesterase [Candidatus Nitrosopolaris sp.]